MTSLKYRMWERHWPDQVPMTLMYPDEPVYHLLDQAALEFPEAEATVFEGAVLRWGEIRRQADAFAAGLAELGVQKGDRVAIMLPNLPQTVIAYFGVLKAGAVVVFFNPLYAIREIDHLLQDSGASVMVTLDLMHARVQKAAAAAQLRKVILTGIRDYMPLPLRWVIPLVRRELVGKIPRDPDVVSFRELMRRHAGQPPPSVSIDPVHDLALIQYTGGTTGLAKGAMLTHRNLMANVLQIRAWFPGLHPGRERILAVMPMFHAYGLTTCFHLGALIAASILLVPRFDVKQVLKLIHRYRPTLFPGTPTLYVAISSTKDARQYDLGSIAACISGAAPLPQEVQAAFQNLTDARVVEGYGLTEASPVTHCNPIHGRQVIGSIGLPLPDTEMKIVDLETGARELGVGEEGELCVRGPQVMCGYWNRPDDTTQALRDGWLHTGDIAWIDHEGYTYIVDRVKDMIIASGYNVYPREVEEVLYQHPAVLEATVLGVPDEYRGQTVKAFVVPKPEAAVTAEEIIAFCRERMAPYKAPTQVAFRKELPKSLVGKVLRRVLLEDEEGS